MRSGLSQDQINNKVRRPYTAWATGDGAKTEFKLPKNVARLDDVVVTLAGNIQRPDEPGTPHDYAVRGISAGYAGDKNFVKFAAAPPLAMNIAFTVYSD